jgi:hypothetical protein
MVGTFGGPTAGAGFRLTPWSGGRADLEVAAASETALLGEALRGLLAAASDGVGREPCGRSVSLRGEARALGELAIALFDALIARIEDFEIAVAGVEIDGIVRSEDGLIGWGNVAIADGPMAELRSIRIVRVELSAAPNLALALTLERTDRA